MLNELVWDCKNVEELLGENGVVKQLTGRMLERMLEGGMTDHLFFFPEWVLQELDRN